MPRRLWDDVGVAMAMEVRPLHKLPEQEGGTAFTEGGQKENAVSRTALVGVVVVALAWTTAGVAGEGRQRPSRAEGAFVSAELAQEVVKWQLDLGEEAGGKKTYEMTVDVNVTYSEKEGVKQARSIRRVGGREFRAREGTVVVKGKFVSAKLQGETVLVTIAPAEGENPPPLEVTLPKQLSVWYREGEEGKLTAYGIGIPRPPRQPKAE